MTTKDSETTSGASAAARDAGDTSRKVGTKAQGTADATDSPYATSTDEDQTGKPVGPEHDGSFHAPDFYDPKTGKRIETDWDTDAQRNDPGFDPEVMAGTTEKRPQRGDKVPSQRGEGEGGASGGEGGEPTKNTKQAPIATPDSKSSR